MDPRRSSSGPRCCPGGDAGPVLVTGANGFIGRSACRRFLDAGFSVRGTVRRPDAPHGLPAAVELCEVSDMGPRTDWSPALGGVQTVVHLAGRAHIMRDRARDPAAEFLAVNAGGTERLARMAAQAGVRRLVFVSSVKVHGDGTAPGAPYCEDSPPAPQDAYAASKWEAEQRLWGMCRETGLEVVVVRPPLVYGPGVKGNLLRLMRWLEGGFPVPVLGVENRRSLIGLDNLADLLLRVAEHPDAAGETFLAADGQDVSTPELVHCLARGLGRAARSFRLPSTLVRGTARLAGREGVIDRLWGSLQVDATKAARVLGWEAPVPVQEGLAGMARWYREGAERGSPANA